MKKLIILILILVVVAVISGWYVFGPASSDSSEKTFTIAKGDGVKEISAHLKEQNFIRNEFVFECYIWLKKVQSKFQAGEYKLRGNMSVAEIVEVLTSGKPTAEVDIKILEGWNNREVAAYLEHKGIVGKEIFLDEVARIGLQMNENEDVNFEYVFLQDRPEGATLEGYLFPDTYRIYREIPKELRGGSDADEALVKHIIKKMLDNFDKKLTADLREEIARQQKTIFEIITMASIIEKEARGEDMAMVSDIFWRRIDEGIALQSDATVNYATGKYETRPNAEDLGVDSPYNTYKYRGLPAGPIGNPGLEAIRAAIYPKENNYWYFLHTKDGQIIYSRNFEEHKANKAKYLE